MGAEQTAVFTVDLETGKVTEGSNSAVQALAQMKSAIERDKSALKELEAQLKLMQSGTSVNVTAFKALKDQIESKKSAIQSSSSEFVKLGGKLGDLGKKTKDAAKDAGGLATKVGELGGKVSQMPGPLGSAGGALSSFASLLANPYIAIAALTAAIVLSVVAIGVLAVKMADASRSNQIFLSALTGSDRAGARLGKSIESLAKTIPLAKAQIQSIGQALNDKGLEGTKLEAAMGAIARTQSVLGQGAAGKLQAIVDKSAQLKRFTANALDFKGSGISLDDVANALAKRTGKTLAVARESIKAGAVDLQTGLQALDDATKTKLGGAAAKLSISLSAIGDRASDVFGSLFADIDIEPILTALRGIIDMFDDSNAEGQALRELAKTVLQPLLEFAAGAGGSAVKAFIQDLVILALVLAIGFFKVKNALSSIGDVDLSQLVDQMEILGSDMIAGLVQGIEDNAGAIVAAMTGAVGQGVAAAKSVLKINSPSKVFEELGAFSVQGYAGGVDDNAHLAEQAMGNMIDPVVARAGAGATSTSSVTTTNKRGGDTHVHLHTPSVGSYAEFRGWFFRVLDEANMAGATPEPV